MCLGGRPRFRLLCRVPELGDDLPFSSSSESSFPVFESSPSESELAGDPFSNEFCDALFPDIDELGPADLEFEEPADVMLRRATPVGVLNVVKVVLSTKFPTALLPGDDDADDEESL